MQRARTRPKAEPAARGPKDARPRVDGTGLGRLLQAIRSWLSYHWSIPAGFLAWELVGRLAGVRWLPPLSEVLRAGVGLVRSGELLPEMLISFRGLAIGYTTAALLGVTLGVLMARYRKVEYALGIYVHALLMTPVIVFAPIFLSIFGLADTTRIVVIILFALFVIVINTFKGFESVDPSLVAMAKSYGADNRQVFQKVMLPAALPLCLTGLRLGLGRAVLGMINGELIVAVVGLGGMIKRFGGRFDSASVLAVVFVVVGVSMLLLRGVRWLDARLTGWMD